MELNREQVVKALTMFIDDMPADLHLGFTRTVIFRKLLQDTLALIRELTEENEGLNSLNKVLVKNNSELETELSQTYDLLEKAKADTVRKMHERLENRIKGNLAYHGWYLKETVIPKIAKELLEEGK